MARREEPAMHQESKPPTPPFRPVEGPEPQGEEVPFLGQPAGLLKEHNIRVGLNQQGHELPSFAPNATAVHGEEAEALQGEIVRPGQVRRHPLKLERSCKPRPLCGSDFQAPWRRTDPTAEGRGADAPVKAQRAQL